MDEDFWTLLSSATQPQAGGRIYWGIAPQDAKLPYVVVAVISATDSPHMQGAGGFWQYRVQVDSYGADRPSARTLSRVIRGEMNGTRAGDLRLILFDTEREIYEAGADQRPFRISQDYIITWRPTNG